MPEITEKQLNYILRLLRDHPDHPLADEDDDDLDDHLNGLSRTQGSDLIEELLNWDGPRKASSVPHLNNGSTGSPSVVTPPQRWEDGAAKAVMAALSEPEPSLESERPFAPSRYMTAILEAAETTGDNLFIEAVAGSGKTTCLVELMKRLAQKGDLNVLFCAFNRAIAEELRRRAPSGVDVATLHSLGFRALKTFDSYVQLDEKAVRQTIVDSMPKSLSNEDRVQAAVFAEKVTGLLKNCLVDPSDEAGIYDLLDRYNIEDNGIGQIIIPLLPFITSELDRSRYISFDDMIYRPAKFTSIAMPRYDVVLIDEAQDLNPAQIAMLTRVAGRKIAVGDRFQSIYGFRGADINAIPRLIETFAMRSLPLSITYRCPLNHVSMAQRLVPHIEAREDAPEGRIEYLAFTQMVQAGVFAPGTLALCRRNAPLIGRAFTLIRAGIPATVKGRDIGQGLLSLIRKLSRPDDTVAQLVEKAYTYHQNERAKLLRREATDTALQALDDRIETLYALTEGCETIYEVTKRIEDLFSDVETRGIVTFSSIHRAKGLEADTVVILEPWFAVKSRKDWEQQQEANVRYVSLTRSKSLMVFEEREGV